MRGYNNLLVAILEFSFYRHSREILMSKFVTISEESDLKRIHSQYFSASRVANLFGCGFGSAIDDYHILRGEKEAPDLDGDIIRRGLLLEPIIDQMMLEDYPDFSKARKNNRFFIHPEIDRFGCTPDRFIRHPSKSDVGLAEYKVINELGYRDDWQGGDVVPLKYQLQIQSQMVCTGKKWGVLIPLIVGTFTFRLADPIFYDYHDGAVERIELFVYKLLRQVDTGIPPGINDYKDALSEIDNNSTGFASDPPQDFSGNDELTDLFVEYRTGAAKEKSGKEAKKIAQAKIFRAIGDVGNVIADGWKLNANNTNDGDDRQITAEMVGDVIKGRKGYRQTRLTPPKTDS